MEDLMAELDLMEPPLKNGKYTWSNKRTSPRHIITRLDMFMISLPFLQKDLLLTSRSIPSKTSYHKLISLQLSTSEKLGPIPFRFNPLWLNDAKALEITQIAWNSNITGSPSYIWEDKLREV